MSLEAAFAAMSPPSGAQEKKNLSTQVPRSLSTQAPHAPEYLGTQEPTHPSTQEPKRLSTQAPKRHGHPGTQEPKNPGTQVPEYPGTQAPGSARIQDLAKSAHPDYEAKKVFIRTETRRRAARKWEDERNGELDFSDLVEHLLQRFLNEG